MAGQETLDKLARISRRVANGEKITKACDAENFSSSMMHEARKKGIAPANLKAKGWSRRKKHKNKKPVWPKHDVPTQPAKPVKPKFVDMVLPIETTSSGHVILVMCTPDQLKTVIAGLK